MVKPSDILFAVMLSGFCLLPAARAATSEFKQPNAYAVIIGISQYREEIIPKVPYAARDAEAMAQVLETQGGIPKTHIKLLTESKATYNDIRNHVGDWLRMRVKPDSTVYIYYAGHGTPNPHTGEAYLVPWEGHPDYPSGLFPLKELYATLNKLPAKEIIVMLDSCFSGASGRSVLPKGTRPMVISLENPLLAGGKVAVLSASTGNQVSSDYDKAGHGLFTHYLLTGLGGEADKDQNHLVTLRELYPYVREHVSETAVDELNREQTPMLLPGEDVLGLRASQPLVQVVPGFAPSLAPQLKPAPTVVPLPKAEDPKPIQETRARPFAAPLATGREVSGKDGAPMVLVAAGEFRMGADSGDSDEQPTHRVLLDAFYMDKYEVTTARYGAFFQTTKGREAPGYWEMVKPEEGGDRPVIGVDWNDADAYCRHYGKRLPTEAEWEKAARGTDGRKYPWGNGEPTPELAHYGLKWTVNSNYYSSRLNPVGKNEAGQSPYGVHDLAGNVHEWVADWYDSGYYRTSPERNPPGPANGNKKIQRGGSWNSDPGYLRTTYRNGRHPTYRNYNVGFRCAADASK